MSSFGPIHPPIITRAFNYSLRLHGVEIVGGKNRS
jgi:hypothetical protein